MAWKKIHNFPPSYPFYKKLFVTLGLNLFSINLFDRDNLLSIKDIQIVKKVVKKGDIVLAGNLKTLFSSVIKDPVTHVGLFINDKTVIEAYPEGVTKRSFKEFLKSYDTLIILRLPNIKNKKQIIKQSVRFVKKQLGKPYSFYFEKSEDSFYCSELVNSALIISGYNTGMENNLPKTRFAKMVPPVLINPLSKVRPKDFIKGKFRIIFTSHNLKIENNKIIFLEKNRAILRRLKELKSKVPQKVLKRFTFS